MSNNPVISINPAIFNSQQPIVGPKGLATSVFYKFLSQLLTSVNQQSSSSSSSSSGTNTILSGSGSPPNSIGSQGDFYIDDTADVLYGPKGVSLWPTGVSLVGPQGPTGTQGPAGATGPQGPPGPAGTANRSFAFFAG